MVFDPKHIPHKMMLRAIFEFTQSLQLDEKAILTILEFLKDFRTSIGAKVLQLKYQLLDENDRIIPLSSCSSLEITITAGSIETIKSQASYQLEKNSKHATSFFRGAVIESRYKENRGGLTIFKILDPLKKGALKENIEKPSIELTHL
jgi:hypothetical protein